MFDVLIERRWGPPITASKSKSKVKPMDQNDNDFELTDHDFDPYSDATGNSSSVMPDIEDTVDSTGRLINQQPAYDQLLNSELVFQIGEDTVFDKVA